MFKPHSDSLFAALLRWPWWAALLVAVGLFFVSRLFLPSVAAAASTFPFLGIAAYAAWRQLQVPGAGRVAKVLEALRAMSWEEFSVLLSDMFRRDGYEVELSKGGVSDLELRKQGYVTLVACRRWKVAQTGIAPLRELSRAREAREARNCILITAGDLSDNAAAFSVEHGVRVLNGVELVQRLGRIKLPAGK